jgi:hypothetical protein
LLATIFPPSTSSSQGIYAIAFPFRSETIFASPLFKKLFLKNDSNSIALSGSKLKEEASKATLSLAFDLILKKFYSLSVPVITYTTHSLIDKQTGLTRFFGLKLNAEFVDVKCINPEYALPENFAPQRTLDLEELKKIFPLENFQFEGLIVIEVNDETQEQVIAEIKNVLLNINSFSDITVFEDLQQYIQCLIGLKDVKIGITPFFKMNEFHLCTDGIYNNSILFKNEEANRHKDKVSQICFEIFSELDQPILYSDLNEETLRSNKLLKFYHAKSINSLILCPLYTDEGVLIGLLEISSTESGKLQFHHLSNVQPALPLFALALEKSAENMELQIDKIIKEHFTAIQPAVEWKFTEAAFYYLQHQQVSEMAKMPNITFDNVFPLYASIDIRNSSTERNNAIQFDMLEQLNMVKDILEKASRVMVFPIVSETLHKIEKYINSVSENLLSDDEVIIYDFLQRDVDAVIKNLRANKPELKRWIDAYFAALDPHRKVIYHHRKDYEESLTRVNDVLDRFIDTEQQDAQEVYPHYFERYVTDGIEFNIYVGQSLSPSRPFNEIYVRNLKLWQLTLLAKAARLTNALEKRLPLPLQTTQLILTHSVPISISFRRKERKFDVDGAYNIRYEIVKKRIDKVHLKDSDERLTQPGKIGIVYSQHKEMMEYMEFIEYLQSEKLLGENVEHLDLEDTQGISGLKAIRVEVNLSNEPSSAPNQELSKITTRQLLRR